jgi:hypothetical protein
LPTDNPDQGKIMRLILRAGVLVLTLTAMAVSAQAGGRLESAAIGAPEGVDITRSSAPAGARGIDTAAEQSFGTGEVLVSLPSNLSLEVIDSLARRHRLTCLNSQSVGLLGRTVHRWRITDERSIPDVILALKLDDGIDAQPNYIYTLQ